MYKKHWLLLPVVLLFSFSSVLAYNSPGQPTGFVNDYADILTPEQEAILENKLNALATSEGSEMTVVTIMNLGGDTIENYAVNLFAEWGIGEQGKDNGLLLLISVGDREMRIEVGYGLESTITDAQAYWIIRDVITPAFKNEDYFGGISGAVDKITEAITGGVILPSSEPRITSRFESNVMNYAFGIFILALAAFLGRTKSFWLGGVFGFIIGFTVALLSESFISSLIIGAILGIIGLLFDLVVSRGGGPGSGVGGGGFRSGGGGGGFGGFGGGRSGGGGASGRW